MLSLEGKEIFVGPGGWAYLPVKGNKLGICSRLFDFVEVNSTFYELPGLGVVKKWRGDVDKATAGDDGGKFRFTVRANRELTHVEHLNPSKKALDIYDKISEICRVLDADVLHFQLSPSYKVGQGEIHSLRDFFSTVNKPTNNTEFALEVRSANPVPGLYRFMEDSNIVHTVDLSKSDPAYEHNNVTYSRIFGKGYKSVYEFDDKEIKHLAIKAQNQKSKRTYMTFHNLSMYEDASRLREIIAKSRERRTSQKPTTEEKNLAPATPGKSLDQVLERLKFPITKKGLIREAGWRTFQKDSERVHVSEVVKDLPDKKYASAREVLTAVQR